MSVETITPGGLLTKDPQAQKVYQFNWTDYLNDRGVTIAGGGSTFVITGEDDELTQDNASIVTGSLKTQVRLLGGTPGVRYTLTNRIITSGSPAMTDDRSVIVLVEDQ